MILPHLGEAGTEQFVVETFVDGTKICRQLIHDPFIHSTTTLQLDRWSAFKQFLKPTPVKIQVVVSGTHAAQRRIMTMNPEEMQQENIQWELECASAHVGVQVCDLASGSTRKETH